MSEDCAAPSATLLPVNTAHKFNASSTTAPPRARRLSSPQHLGVLDGVPLSSRANKLYLIQRTGTSWPVTGSLPPYFTFRILGAQDADPSTARVCLAGLAVSQTCRPVRAMPGVLPAKRSHWNSPRLEEEEAGRALPADVASGPSFLKLPLLASRWQIPSRSVGPARHSRDAVDWPPGDPLALPFSQCRTCPVGSERTARARGNTSPNPADGRLSRVPWLP